MNNELNEYNDIPLPEHGKGMPYSVPEGYFEQLPQALLAIAKEDAPALPATGKAMPHTVPNGYFARLPAQILAKVGNTPAPKRIKMLPRLSNMAAAASLVLIFTAAAYVYWSVPQSNNAAQHLATVSQADIAEYLTNSGHCVYNSHKNTTTLTNLQAEPQDIKAYLDEVGWE